MITITDETMLNRILNDYGEVTITVKRKQDTRYDPTRRGAQKDSVICQVGHRDRTFYPGTVGGAITVVFQGLYEVKVEPK